MWPSLSQTKSVQRKEESKPISHLVKHSASWGTEKPALFPPHTVLCRSRTGLCGSISEDAGPLFLLHLCPVISGETTLFRRPGRRSQLELNIRWDKNHYCQMNAGMWKGLYARLSNVSGRHWLWLGDGVGVGRGGQWGKRSVALGRDRQAKQLLNHLAWNWSSLW